MFSTQEEKGISRVLLAGAFWNTISSLRRRRSDMCLVRCVYLRRDRPRKKARGHSVFLVWHWKGRYGFWLGCARVK